MKPKNEIREMSAYCAPTSGRKGLLRLDFNERVALLPAGFAKALSGIDLEQLSVYPEYGLLEKAIAQYAGAGQSQVLACNGSDEGIRIAFDCFLRKGAKVVLPWPSFAMFEQYARIAGGKIAKVLYGKDLSFPAQRVLQAICAKTGAVVLCNPNNPTGSAIKKKDIERILKRARQKNSLVFLDEAYYEFSGETAAGLIKEFDNLIIARTFSKAFGLAGLRLGYVLSCSENIKEMRKVASPYSVNSIAALLGRNALLKRQYMKAYVKEVRLAKKIFEKGLKKIKVQFYPSNANFVLARFENSKTVLGKLREQGILVRDRSSDELLDDCIRITIGTRGQMRKFLDKLAGILARKALVFDMDGVLVDESISYRRAIQQTVRFFTGKRLSLKGIQEKKNEMQINNDWLFSKKIIGLLGKKVELRQVVEKFQEFYLGKKFNGLIRNEKLLLGKKTLEKLRQKFDLFIFTGRPRQEAVFALKRFGIRQYFRQVVAMEDIPSGKQKPNPFGLKKILGKNKNAFYAGDALQDIECAKRAGIKAIAVLPPQDKSKKLVQAMLEKGAEFVLQDVNEIGKVIE